MFFQLVSFLFYVFGFECGLIYMGFRNAGVAGGTASGKTTVCDMIIQQLHDHRVVLVNQVHLPSLLCLNSESCREVSRSWVYVTSDERFQMIILLK